MEGLQSSAWVSATLFGYSHSQTGKEGGMSRGFPAHLERGGGEELGSRGLVVEPSHQVATVMNRVAMIMLGRFMFQGMGEA